jgi:hypothetical protein
MKKEKATTDIERKIETVRNDPDYDIKTIRSGVIRRTARQSKQAKLGNVNLSAIAEEDQILKRIHGIRRKI